MLTVSLLNDEEVERIFREEMPKDFPETEIEELWRVREWRKKGKYTGLGVYEDDMSTGYVFTFNSSENRSVHLVEYFAIYKDFRNRGIVGKFMEFFLKSFPEGDILLGEVENPFRDCVEESARHKKSRMDLFCKRFGWQDSGVDALMFGVEYRILYYAPGLSLTEKEVMELYEKIFRDRLPDDVLKNNMEIRSGR